MRAGHQRIEDNAVAACFLRRRRWATLAHSDGLDNPIGDRPIGAHPVWYEIGQHDLDPVHWRRAKNGIALIDEIEDRPDHKCDATGPKRYSVRQRKTNNPSQQRRDASLIDTWCRPKNVL